MGGYDVDVDELRIDLAEATDRALELADELAAAVEAGRDSRGALLRMCRRHVMCAVCVVS
jgi:hypothetical protein